MSVLSIAGVPFTEEEIKDHADLWTSLAADNAEEDLDISGTRYLLFSEDELHKLIVSVIQDLNRPAED